MTRTMRTHACRLLAVFLAVVFGVAVEGRAADLLRAFPGAEGFGAATPGGRGGRVLFVTTLEDYIPGKDAKIPGSLRAAVMEDGPRYVLFRVSGTIALQSDLVIRNPYITLAGQTAPGGGICIKDYQVVLGTHDVVIRHLRFRSGDETRREQMAVGIFGGNNSIIDHCSMSWAIDEVMSSFGTVHNLTVQWSIVAEGLSRSYHPKGEHSKGSILNGDGGLTIHHCIYAHNASRNPRVDAVVLDWRNNVVYNWGYRCAYTPRGASYLNYTANYFKPGPDTTRPARARIYEPGTDMPRIFLDGNVLEGFPDHTADNSLMVARPKEAPPGFDMGTLLVAQPFPCPPVRTQSARDAFELVLERAGATLPQRDAADARLIEEIRTGGGAIIRSPEQVGGWPVLASAPLPADSDNDGMPDEWETANSLDPSDPADALADADGDGYPNLEEYLNGTSPHVPKTDCRMDAQEFRAIQQAALEIAAHGAAERASREAARAAEREATKETMIHALRVDTVLHEDGRRLVMTLGGNVELEMVRIPAGHFLMGSPESEGGLENERPQHRVNISRPFYMAATPVTTAQFLAVFGPDARQASPEIMDLPVHEATWYEAVEFCEILSAATGRRFRLPTEAEWEYACRAGTTTAFYTGDMISSDQANFDGETATRYNPAGIYRGRKTPVRMFPPNPWGLYDMHGNEAEWCQDRCFRVYTAEEVTDPVEASSDGARVLRGGKAGSKAFFIRSAYRYGYAPGVGYGFRVVLETEQ